MGERCLREEWRKEIRAMINERQDIGFVILIIDHSVF